MNIWILLGINVCLWLIIISNANVKLDTEKSNKPLYKSLFILAIVLGTLLIQCLI